MTMIVWKKLKWIFLEIGGSKEEFVSFSIEKMRFSENLPKKNTDKMTKQDSKTDFLTKAKLLI